MWPWLPQLDGPIPTYYLIISISFTLCSLWILKRSKSQNFNQHLVIDLLLVLMFASFIGARAFQVIFEDPLFYLSNPVSILKFWQGGFVFYGGFTAALIASLIYYKFRPFDYFKFSDVIAPPLALGYSLGRWGCFFSGCCYGKPSQVPWAVIFPPWSESPSGIPLHPTQIYSSIWELTVFILLLKTEKYLKSKNAPTGLLFATFLILHGFGRALIEQFRGDFRGTNVFNLSISTWISILLIIGGAIIIAKRKNVPSTT